MIKVDKFKSNQTFTGAGKIIVSNKKLMRHVQDAMVEFAEENKLLLGTDSIYGLLNRNTGKDMFIFSHNEATIVKKAEQEYIKKAHHNGTLVNDAELLQTKLDEAAKINPKKYIITTQNLNDLPKIIKTIVSN